MSMNANFIHFWKYNKNGNVQITPFWGEKEYYCLVSFLKYGNKHGTTVENLLDKTV